MSSLKRSFSEKRIDDSAVNPVIKKISSRILPGALTPANKDAVDWGFQSLLAYGCHKHVVVIDTRYTQVFQTLTGHKHNVTKVNWSRNLHYHDLVNPYHLKLASADTSGTVLVWDVSLATVRSTLVEPDRTVLELGWLLGGESNHHLLLALYSLGTLVLWHADTGAQVWRKCYTEPPVSFSLDPFCESTVLFLAADHLLLVEDLNGQQAPVGSGHKWSLPSVAYSPSEEKSKPRSRLISGVKSLIRTGDNRTGIEEALPLNECLQLCYHRAVRHQLFLVYPKKIFVVDTEVQQVLGVIPLERNGSAFVCCHPCWECDFLLCLHESGSVSARFRHEDNESLAGELDQASGLITYDTLCISEALRLSKHSKVNGMAVCQSSQCKVALLLGDGRIVFLKMALTGKVAVVEQTAKLTSMMKGSNTGTLRLLTTGLLEGLAPGPHLSRMCPPVTFGNWSTYRPLLAVGNTTGSVQVFDLSSGTLEKELNLHATPVRGIEWVSLTSFLSFAYANLITVGSKVRNEIVLTSIQSGRVQQVRADANEESPVTCIKVSHLKQYFVVLFKDQPFELWDLRSLVLLRTMPDSFPCVTALEWSPLVSSKAQLRARHLANPKDVEPIFANSATEQLERQLDFACRGQQAASPLLREQLVFTDTEAQLYYFSVEGNVVRDCTRNPPEAGMASVTSIAWKSDHIVLGDAEGTLTVWDLKGKVLRALPTQRGHVKKLKFAPGKGNMKILALFTDGISAWDAQDVQLFVQVRCPQDLPGITDVDWAKSDKLVVATSDGCIRIMDMEMKSCSSPVSNHLQTSRVPFVPQLLPPKAALQLKSLLQHPDMGPAAVPSSLSEESSLHERLQQASLQCKAPSKAGVIERNVAVASWFGDEEGFHFWSVTQYYLTKKQQNLNTSAGTSLPLCYDMLCPDAEYKALQLKRLLFHERQRMVHSHTQRCVCRLLLLGQADQAVQLLLETEAASEHFYSDSLRACLVASLKTESKAQSVVKLVATNLIANGRTWDGVQLLCLIGKGLDACRYLQAAGQWEDSVWLAKCTLSDAANCEVISKWAEHLIQQNQKGKAVLVLLSVGQYARCLQTLHAARMVERAALFLDACLEHGLLPREHSSLFQNVWLDYARYLHSLGNKRASLHYCSLAGEAATDLRKEVEMLLDEEEGLAISEREQET
ncbi:WD repeat-containing protein 11 isoform X1 [Dermacentor silvarum]|uniref:WD repeat-containing protein 11 isoform X1 n=1 Tax=Dermacentor silvarum TaxID=543639 RepID=UPI00210162ED|nr:WD repeat-containing protein 11 isoform X1 [Dermacentor silvarum]